jgi:hypothetical protein
MEKGKALINCGELSKPAAVLIAVPACHRSNYPCDDKLNCKYSSKELKFWFWNLKDFGRQINRPCCYYSCAGLATG